MAATQGDLLEGLLKALQAHREWMRAMDERDEHRMGVGATGNVLRASTQPDAWTLAGPTLDTYKAAVRRKHEEAQKWRALAEEYQRRLMALGGDERRRE